MCTLLEPLEPKWLPHKVIHPVRMHVNTTCIQTIRHMCTLKYTSTCITCKTPNVQHTKDTCTDYKTHIQTIKHMCTLKYTTCTTCKTPTAKHAQDTYIYIYIYIYIYNTSCTGQNRAVAITCLSAVDPNPVVTCNLFTLLECSKPQTVTQITSTPCRSSSHAAKSSRNVIRCPKNKRIAYFNRSTFTICFCSST